MCFMPFMYFMYFMSFTYFIYFTVIILLYSALANLVVLKMGPINKFGLDWILLWVLLIQKVLILNSELT